MNWKDRLALRRDLFILDLCAAALWVLVKLVRNRQDK